MLICNCLYISVLCQVNVSSQSAPYGSCDDGEEYRQKTGNVYTIEVRHFFLLISGNQIHINSLSEMIRALQGRK